MEDEPRFSPFSITSTPYKIINGTEIPLWVFVPKDAHTGPRPIMIHLHGGFLVTGHAMYPDWVAQWALDYALQHSAIRISANYRLLPEANGTEILADIGDLLSWVENSLPTYLASLTPISTTATIPQADLDRIMIYGESAGGYLSLLASLSNSSLIKAVIAAYPMTDITSPWYSSPSTETLVKSPFGAPLMPLSIFEKHTSTADRIFSGGFPPQRMNLALAILQHGLFPSVMGTENSLDPFKVLSSFSNEKAPPHLFLFHGTGDSAVPVSHSQAFMKAWNAKFGKENADAHFEEGGEHGCDGVATLETEWLKKGLEGVTSAWIGR